MRRSVSKGSFFNIILCFVITQRTVTLVAIMIKINDDNYPNFDNNDHDEGASGASGDLFRVSDEDLWPGEATSSTSAGNHDAL